MSWVEDGAKEREFTGTGNVVLTAITAAGGGSSNNDYVVFVVTHARWTADSQNKLSSCNMEDESDGGKGGDLIELMRMRMKSSTAETVTQIWGQRNADFSGGVLNFEGAPSTIKVTGVTNNADSTIYHMGVYIYRSTALPLAGDLVDYLEGGYCEVGDDDTASDTGSPTFGALKIVNADSAASMGIVTRYQGVSGTISGTVPNCDVQSYNIFDNLDTNFAFVNAAYTTVIQAGRGMDANQCLAKTNTGTNTLLILAAFRMDETAVAGGPLVPTFDGDDEDTRNCNNNLSTPIVPGQRRRGRFVYELTTV